MDKFTRNNQYLSLCGLNCSLCSMNLGKYCPGCGQGCGNQLCAIARCSMKKSNFEYCIECNEYPCTYYHDIDKYDSFITHQNQKSNLEKIKTMGSDTYNQEQIEKREILEFLLEHYNDGCRKTFYCLAINLLELNDIRSVIKSSEQLESNERTNFIVNAFKQLSSEQEIELKLRKK
ncbi:DUF3795 domain-containing protein [Anaerorhabdus sp.]|uniref:DUF3795 domain-containing protein n=1 Tax=Anaerorhabdus sp. TaxID=1872524 RepID=UPI002FCA1FF9